MKRQLHQFREKFPQETAKISKLRPLDSKEDLIDDVLIKVSQIVHLSRRRFDRDHIDLVVQSIRSSNAAAADIQKVMEGVAKLDMEQLETILFVATEVFPKPFLEGRNLMELLRLLKQFATLMLALNVAIRLATGISEAQRGRGRPPSPYVRPALDLIEVWEFATSEKFADDLPVQVIRRVPTPKRLETRIKDQNFNSKQPSTVFVGIALRMIDPQITNAEVFTAIKVALTLREKQYEIIRHKPKTLLDLIKAVGRSSDA